MHGIGVDQQLTQADLGEQAGVSKSTVERVEIGASVQLTTVIRILRILDLCGLDHYDFNMVGAYSYEQALLVIRPLGLSFKACARAASMKRGRAESIIKGVRHIGLRWQNYADEVGVSSQWRDQIQKHLR